MSYSISATKPTMAELEVEIREKLAAIPETQPLHEADIVQARDAAHSLLALMHDDPDRDLYGSVSGSIWKTETGVEQISLNVSFSYTARKSAG